MVATAAEHVVAHCIGTIPGLLSSSVYEVNDLLGCANKDDTSGYLPVDLSIFSWPDCPLTEIPDNFTEALFLTMPGLTGVLLVLLLWGVYYTGSQQGRKENFDRFIYLHNVLVIVWPILLFLHGTQGWIGVGFPLVAFTSTIPILCYTVDRILRALRYFLYAGKQVQIVSCTVRPGKDDTPAGGLVYLQISQPPKLWTFHPGMYAFLCMPEYAPLQWHPFTICSGDKDTTVDFLIAGVGDWTRELGRRAMLARKEGVAMPKVGIDGPYAAPTMSALSKNVLIAVGAGVGITPFLSLMSSIISAMSNLKKVDKLPLKEAHFYWSTRGVDEFLFGRDLFSKIVQSPHLRDRVFLHLHTTCTAPDKDPACYVFREAIKKQSAVDREAFKQSFEKVIEKGTGFTGPQLPWCWVDGSKQDVLWLSHLVKSLNEVYEKDVESAFEKTHWGSHFLGNVGMRNAQTLADLGTVLGTKPKNKGTASKTLADRTSAFGASAEQEVMSVADEAKLMLPVVFGRPDFGTEVRSIGKSRPNYDVDIYICGNDAIVKNLQETVVVCNQHAERDFAERGGRQQYYTVHYERFG